MLKGQDPARLA